MNTKICFICFSVQNFTVGSVRWPVLQFEDLHADPMSIHLIYGGFVSYDDLEFVDCEELPEMRKFAH